MGGRCEEGRELGLFWITVGGKVRVRRVGKCREKEGGRLEGKMEG